MTAIRHARLLPLLVLVLAACGEPRAQDPTEPVVVEAPQDGNALRQTAFAAQGRGDHAAAADAFLALSRLEPSEPNWVVRAGDNLGRAGRIDEAIDLLATTRKRFPDALAIQSMLARTYALKADATRMTSGRDATVQLYYEDAVRTARAVLAIDAEDQDARLVLASSLLELGEAEAAFEEATIAVAKAPRAYSTQALLGRIAYERFVAAQRSAAEAEGEAKSAATALGNAMRDAATAAFRAAAEAEPSRSFPKVALGDLLAWSGDLPGASARYGEALALDPWAKVNHDWLRSALGGKDRAELYAKAVQVAPNDDEMRGYLNFMAGVHAFESRDVALGVQYMKSAETYNASMFGERSAAVAEVAYNTAQHLYSAGESSAALPLASRAVEIYEGTGHRLQLAFALYLRSAVQIRLRAHSGAVDDADAAVRVLPEGESDQLREYRLSLKVGLVESKVADGAETEALGLATELQMELDRSPNLDVPGARDELHLARARVFMARHWHEQASRELAGVEDPRFLAHDPFKRAEALGLHAQLPGRPRSDSSRTWTQAAAIFETLGSDGATHKDRMLTARQARSR